MLNTDTEFSVIIPVYNSEKTLEELAHRISSVFAGLNTSFEIILVDDGSRDTSWNVMKKLRADSERIRIIKLVRNFGQHNATLCGFRHARGNRIVVMDDDLQNPPEEIPKLIEKLSQGYTVVYAAYDQKKHRFMQNLLSNIFQRLMHYILNIPSSIMISSFVICSHEVIQHAIATRTAFPFLTALITKNTSMDKITNVYVEHVDRKTGRSNYNIWGWLRLSLSLIINYSSLPLQIIAAVGLLASCASILFGIYIIIARLLDPTYGLMGWNSLIVATTLLGGLILTSMSVVGEYLRRIIAEISYEQQYLIADEEA